MSLSAAKLEEYVKASVVEILGHADYQRVFTWIKEPEDSDLLRMPLMGVISLEGPRSKAHLMCACSAEFLSMTNPISDAPRGKEDSYAREWLGELVNLVAGQLKRKLGQHDFDCKISPPAFAHYVRSSPVALEHFGNGLYGDEGQVIELWFEADRQRICFQLGCILT